MSAPALARAAAIAWPMPLEAPVTSAVWPVNEKSDMLVDGENLRVYVWSIIGASSLPSCCAIVVGTRSQPSQLSMSTFTTGFPFSSTPLPASSKARMPPASESSRSRCVTIFCSRRASRPLAIKAIAAG